MKIEGAGRYIKMIILDVQGPKHNRIVTFEITGLEGLDRLTIGAENGFVQLLDNVEVRVLNNPAKYLKDDEARILYRAPKCYEFYLQE